ESARIVAAGDREAVSTREGARNEILKAKAELLADYGDDASSVIFMQQKLPELYAAYMKAAESGAVDNLVVMNDNEGFSGAVNRGPRAFADFLKTFADAFGVDVKALAMPSATGGTR
ncbi:MAG: hypothetical protein JXM71_11190, partial [Spirochaetales bacterium]|nr:hypothetical protein [Spirochaetales bacterium]